MIENHLGRHEAHMILLCLDVLEYLAGLVLLVDSYRSDRNYMLVVTSPFKVISTGIEITGLEGQ
jgi:hypothetical protein